MKYLDYDNKKVTKLNRNYFFAATIAIVSVTILLHAVLGSRWELKLLNKDSYFSLFLNGFFGCLAHHNWQHVILNMLCFFVCGLYLERKLGTLRLIYLVIFLCFFSRFAILATLKGGVGAGFSNVNYALYGFIIVSYFFEIVSSIRQNKNDMPNIIIGAIVVFLIVLTFFFNGGTDSFNFAIYPYDLLQPTHWPGLLVGIMTALFLQINQNGKKPAAGADKL